MYRATGIFLRGSREGKLKLQKSASDSFVLFANAHTEIGEGPLWNDREQALYWIDVSRGELFRKLPDGKPDVFEHYRPGKGAIGGMVFTKDNACLVFADKGLVWKWTPGKEMLLEAELKDAAGSRFNDVIADPLGGVFCGVTPSVRGETGSLWHMDADRKFNCIESKVIGMPNGMGFSPDHKHFYFTVTSERTIYRYDYKTDGTVANRIPFIKIPETEGIPDGMTVDSEGCIWSGQWDGARLVRYSPAGEKLVEYIFPIQKISCVTFGGADLRDIYVTTANMPWSAEADASQHAGSVFVMSQFISGMSEFRV